MVTTRDFLPPGGAYGQLAVRFDPEFGAVWYTLEPRDRPCFNLDLLEELRQFQLRIEAVIREAAARGEPVPVRYTVLRSAVPGVFNLGGDLHLFARLIRAQDRRGLFRYAKACIDVLYPNAVNFDQPLTTITLVQGDALGGGFEAAISSNVVISERSPKYGLPEVLFNLVPGMGAYSFLIRRTSPDIAERIIMTGDLLSAQDMRDLKLVDRVVDDGRGEQAVLDFMREHRKRSNAHAAMGRIRRCIQPVTYEELITITRIWVDAALQLAERDLLLIERLIQAQNRRVEKAAQGQQRALEGHG
ncbi:MAG: crotonase/enoyl-CoA hydratase family protein [Krumholzibacteria bacterium]|nr:crotonase/enoyl-CoA hydratase family protein [Candidatus Krumholzibacteria bacterium]